MNRQLTLLVVAAALTWACAGVKKGELEELKPAIESFHQRIRWKDFRAAAELVVPERRLEFIRARMANGDDRDFFITDFQLEDAQISKDLLSAEAVSRVSWYRLPSNTEQSAFITSTYVWRDSHWLLESQDAGPFTELLRKK